MRLKAHREHKGIPLSAPFLHTAQHTLLLEPKGICCSTLEESGLGQRGSDLRSRGSNVASARLLCGTLQTGFCSLHEDDPRVSCEQASCYLGKPRECPEGNPGQSGIDAALGLCEQG